MTSQEFIERLIEDVKKLVTVASDTKTLAQVNAETAAYARNPKVDINRNHDKSTCEFAFALNVDLMLPFDLGTIAKWINNFKPIFSLKEDKYSNYILFLKELEAGKADLIELFSRLENRVYMDLATGEKANFPEIFLKKQFDHVHFEITVSYRNYEKLLTMR
jgi:hypothetical protein